MFLKSKNTNVIKLFIVILLLIGISNASLIFKKSSPSSCTVFFPIKKSVKATYRFAITTQPNISTTADLLLKNRNGTVSNFKVENAGWMGNRYIQWFSFSADNYKNDTVVININFNKSILKSSNIESLSGPVVNLPLISIPNSPIKRIGLPNHNVIYGIRLEISKDGLYKITGEELISLGVPLNSVPVKLFKLYCRNIETPIYISGSEDGKFDSDDQLYFNGKFLRGDNSYYTSYSYSNVYWLTWTETSPGLRYAEVSGGSEKDPDDFSNISINQAKFFVDTIHVEKDNDIRWLGDLFEVSETGTAPSDEGEIDNWYWGFAGDKELTHFKFNLPAPYLEGSSNCKLRVALGGLSNLNDLDPDHNFSIHLNDDPTDIEAIWDGQNEKIFETNSIPITNIKSGENIITFIKNLPDSIPDRIAINWFEFTYERAFKAHENILNFKSNKSSYNKLTAYKLENFKTEQIELWDVLNFRKFKNINIQKDTKEYIISFYDSISTNANFISLSKSEYLSPDKMKLDTINREIFSVSSDYIIISTDTLLPIIEPLAQHHRDNGLNVTTFNIQDIYNTFSYGIHNPESIRDAIKYIYARNSTNPPKYLLLGGDASHDMDKQRRHLNVVPTHLSRTPNWGPSADDGYFTKVNGNDNFMDLMVGRLPAEGPEDMQIIIDKTINYLKSPEYGQWRDNIILAGGFEDNFTKFNNEAVTNIIDNKFSIYRMDADPKSSYYIGGSSAADMMAGYINGGVYFINFLGHGGGNVWSDSKFFSYSDLEKLHNSRWSTGGRLPIIFSFTCLTGFFESVFYRSLGEEFLRNSHDGAISFYGAAGYTRRNIDIDMSRTLMQTGLSNNISTLGELTTVTEIMMLAQNESEALPLINQYNLLGDPALPWAPSKNLTNISLSKKKHIKNDTLKITGTTTFGGNGQASIQVLSENLKWSEKVTSVTNGQFSINIPLKENSSTTDGTVRCFAWSDTSIERGSQSFLKDAFSLYDLNLTPQIPIAGDSLYLECYVDLLDSTTQPIIQCLFTIGDPAEEFYNFNDSSYVFMLKDSLTNKWVSSTPIIVPSQNLSNFSSPHLILQFKSTGTLGISPYYVYKIKGIADLVLLKSSCKIDMINDSLKLHFSVLNSGTEKAINVPVLFTLDNSDTLYSSSISDTLNPGETYNCTTTITDLNGRYLINGAINISQQIPEIDFSNNNNTFPFHLSYKDLLVPTDTLTSIGGGLLVNPVRNLSSQRRIFLFYDTLNEGGPLLSNSQFISTGDDGFTSFKIGARPSLSSQDSLKLTFHINSNYRSDTVMDHSIFAFNEMDSIWFFKSADIDTSKDRVTIVTQKSHFLAPASYFDKTGPSIRAYVNGKEVIYIDYVAKGMPFNILFNDTSGINPNTISILLNGTELSDEQQSTTSHSENFTSITITAYPPEMHNIDTLTVNATDLAGNSTTRDFIYRPGQNLKINFFSCHPNPFAARKGDRIRFAYLLTDAATSVEMTIYSIAGRKVWRWKNDRPLSGYQEIVWDGTTENNRINGKGYRIANGTYYAKLVAKNGKRKVEKIIRIAKLEGY